MKGLNCFFKYLLYIISIAFLINTFPPHIEILNYILNLIIHVYYNLQFTLIDKYKKIFKLNNIINAIPVDK